MKEVDVVMAGVSARPIEYLPDGTYAAARRMHQVWFAEQHLAKLEGREMKVPRMAPSTESVRQHRAAQAKRARKAEKAARLQARPALGVIAFLCWATDRGLAVNVKVVEGKAA